MSPVTFTIPLDRGLEILLYQRGTNHTVVVSVLRGGEVLTMGQETPEMFAVLGQAVGVDMALFQGQSAISSSVPQVLDNPA